MEKMGLLSSQGCMVTGQEVMDTSCFKENSGCKTKLLMLSTVTLWSRLPREVMESPLLVISKSQLDRTLGNLL